MSANVRGCRWKIWLMNESESEAGGVYLFEDDASLKAFLEGPLVAQVTSHPALSDFSVKQFDVLEAVTNAQQRGACGDSRQCDLRQHKARH